jgi:hypothetical protein
VVSVACLLACLHVVLFYAHTYFAYCSYSRANLSSYVSFYHALTHAHLTPQQTHTYAYIYTFMYIHTHSSTIHRFKLQYRAPPTVPLLQHLEQHQHHGTWWFAPSHHYSGDDTLPALSTDGVHNFLAEMPAGRSFLAAITVTPALSAAAKNEAKDKVDVKDADNGLDSKPPPTPTGAGNSGKGSISVTSDRSKDFIPLNPGACLGLDRVFGSSTHNLRLSMVCVCSASFGLLFIGFLLLLFKFDVFSVLLASLRETSFYH